MKLSEFSASAIVRIMIQASNHLLFAKNIEENIERVEQFFYKEPELYEIFLTELPNYMDHLKKSKGFDARAKENLGYIINKLREEPNSNRKKQYYEIANELVDKSRYKVDNSIMFQVIQIDFRCSNPLEYYKFCWRNHNDLYNVITSEIEQAFTFTEIVAKERVKDVEKVAKNPAFLRYCNLLLSLDQCLLNHRDFLNFILYVLYFNRAYRYFAKEDTSDILTPEFFRSNDNVERRIRTYAKKNQIEID